jgi:hypothetical protein
MVSNIVGQSILHHGASDQTFRLIYHFVKRESLDWRVGIVFVEIIQPTPANTIGSRHGCNVSPYDC